MFLFFGDAGFAQLLTGGILILAVALGLLLVIMGKRMVQEPEGNRFSLHCPHCDEVIEVELRLEPLGVQEFESK